jgi:hypothetical protein
MRGIAILLVALALPAQAQDRDALYSGNGYYSTCAQPNGPLIKGACLGYIIGLSDYAVLHRQLGGPGAPCFNLPGNSNYQQYQDIFLEYLRRNPAERHKLTVILFTNALTAAFPCSFSPSR